MYEAAGEESLAAASYRTAIELQPSLGVLKDGLMGMDNRFAKPAIPAVAQQEKPTLPVTKASTKKSKKKGKKGKSVQQIAAAPISAPYLFKLRHLSRHLTKVMFCLSLKQALHRLKINHDSVANSLCGRCANFIPRFRN